MEQAVQICQSWADNIHDQVNDSRWFGAYFI